VRDDVSVSDNRNGLPVHASRSVDTTPILHRRLVGKRIRAMTGYRFKSPWNGDCFFSPNMLGTSLKVIILCLWGTRPKPADNLTVQAHTARGCVYF